MDYKNFEKKFLNAIGNYFHPSKTQNKEAPKKTVMQRIHKYAQPNTLKSLTFKGMVSSEKIHATSKTTESIRGHLNKKSDDLKKVGPHTLRTEKFNTKNHVINDS